LELAMGRDYYGTICVGRDATDEELKNGYRTVAMKWHPQKNPNRKEEAESKFREIAEAYDVLIDPVKRARYDQYGEDGLKNGTMELNSEFRGYQYVGDPFALFQKFFGSVSPFAEVTEMVNQGTGLAPRTLSKTAEDSLEMELSCTLEELYEGVTKKVAIERSRIRPDGRSVSTDKKLFTVPIRKGWRAGTRLTFKGEGHQTHPKIAAGDLVFVVVEEPHPNFVRAGNDLVYTHKVSLCESLIGHTLNVTTLDKNVLSLHIPEVTSPAYEKRLRCRGMPNPEAPEDMGDLVIRWDIAFPKTITSEEKASISAVLKKTEEASA
jgi:DnaJ-class molecular chaperone